MPNFTYKIAPQGIWEKLPPPKTAKIPDEYDDIVDQLEAGEVVEIEAEDNKFRGIRITLGRKSHKRGFAVEFRMRDNMLYVRRSDESVQPTRPKHKLKEKDRQELEQMAKTAIKSGLKTLSE